MSSDILTRVNAMPAITWHRLKMNWAEVELPETATLAMADAVRLSLPAEVAKRAQSGPYVAAIADGVGTEAASWMRSCATMRQVIIVPTGAIIDNPIEITVAAQAGLTTVAAIDVIAEASSQAHLILHTDAPSHGAGIAGTVVRVHAGEDARLAITCLQTLADGYTHFDSIGIRQEARSRVDVAQTVLGAAESYTGFTCDLAGDEADCRVDTRYLGHGAQVVDFNYLIRHHGRQTTCTLDAGGVLSGSSKKTLRGTIDLVRGCKGSSGIENETVLLTSDDARNKTIPIILCTEDDVQGAHGASIGHVNPEQLEYLQSRGLDIANIEALFEAAVFDYAATAAPTQTGKQAVNRLGSNILGDMFALLKEDDDE